MTIQEKAGAIQKIVANHQDNIAAKNAANISAGLEDLVIEAINNAFKDDLAKVFVLNASNPREDAKSRGKKGK